ncbi:AraC family transcriptional regulator [Rhizobium sp. TRM95111]|uniref:helix-turn-helix domain-containing protein n=1 Tax=Rhizobium alarense TaxID=2846851 RepID=UPI001F1A03F0|nr:helix-turn-helix domain-containing protein [Rhizobium alarense]MCF3643033.1 AraC family transcriptional regulator [Rhizobium alarense]
MLSGGGRVSLGLADLALAGPSIVWTPAGERGAVIFEAGAEGAALAVPELALGPAMPGGAIFTEVRDAIARPILGAKITLLDARKMVQTVETIEAELRENGPGMQEVVRHHLALLLIAIWRRVNPPMEKPKPSPRATVRSFLHLVELHMREQWSLADYAGVLGVTPDRLNTAVRRATGRTPMELIHARMMMEAEMLLDGSSLQIAQVAEALGFRDAAYFSRFFKRLAGVSPRDRRAGLASRHVREETSYAAWP